MAVEQSSAIALTSLLFIGGVQMMDQLGPGIDTVRTADPGNTKVRAQLNVAEAWAAVTVLGAGVALAIMTERPEPIVMAGVVVVGSVVAYELAWRANPNVAAGAS